MVREIVLGNGSLLVNLDSSLRVRDLYFPYAGQENHVLGRMNRIGVHAEGFSWLEEWDTVPEYREETIVTSSTARNGIEDLEMEFNSCVHCEKNVFLREVTVRNGRDEDREVEIFFEQEFDLYGTGKADTVFFSPEESGLVHYKKNRYVMADIKREEGSCGDLNQYGIYREDPDEDIRRGELNGNPIAQGNVCSVVSIELDIPAGSEKTFQYWMTTGRDLEGVRELNRETEERVRNFFEETEMCWRGYLGKLDCDTGLLDEHVEEQLKRSILVIRSQTNDNGAITAANDSENLEFNQDKYGYLWPRDGALVAESMASAGYGDLVRPFFDFVEDAMEEEGYLLHKYNPDGSLGSSWHPWVDGSGEPQLPIQEDETALVLWAMKRFHEETGDRELLEEKYESVVRPMADFIHGYFDEDLHLPEPSYDLWEEERYVSSFTVASVYAGLKAAEEISEILDRDGERYGERAREIKEKGLERLRSGETERYGRGLKDGELVDEVSAPLIFLWKFGLVEPDDSYFENTFNAIRYDLSPDTEVGGIARYRGDHYHNVTEDFDRVPGNPWIICTLWAAQYMIGTADSIEELEEAKDMMHWTCENSLETGLLPEQVDPFTGEGKSVAPLTWSHSTFIETTLLYEGRKKQLT